MSLPAKRPGVEHLWGHRDAGLCLQLLAAGPNRPLDAIGPFHRHKERDPSSPNRTQVKPRGLPTGGGKAFVSAFCTRQCWK